MQREATPRFLLRSMSEWINRGLFRGLEGYKGIDLFTQVKTGHSDHCSLGDCWMGEQNRFDLLRKDRKSTPKNSLPLPPHNPDPSPCRLFLW